jgi:hypothetical protein
MHTVVVRNGERDIDWQAWNGWRSPSERGRREGFSLQTLGRPTFPLILTIKVPRSFTLSHRRRAVKRDFSARDQGDVRPTILYRAKTMIPVSFVAPQSRCQLVFDPMFLDEQRKPQTEVCRQYPSHPSNILNVNKGKVRGLNLA